MGFLPKQRRTVNYFLYFTVLFQDFKLIVINWCKVLTVSFCYGRTKWDPGNNKPYIASISNPIKNNFRLLAQRSWEKFPGTHVLNVFEVMYVFLVTESLKPVTCNALWERLKMLDNRKLIDAMQHFSLVYSVHVL